MIAGRENTDQLTVYSTEFDLIFLLSFDTRYFIMWLARSLKDKLYVEFIKNIQYSSCLASPAALRLQDHLINSYKSLIY